MRGKALSVAPHVAVLPGAFLLLCGLGWGQTSLNLASGSAPVGSAISLPLSLNDQSSNPPASLQWTLTYSSAITGITATGSAALAGAGKSITCNPTPGAFICIASGLNSNAIPNGVIATVDITAAAGATGLDIGVTNSLGASAAADSIPITASGATVTFTPQATPSALTCSPAILEAGGTSTCAVTLSMAASSSVAVSLHSDNGLLPVPTSVNVSAGATSATFTVTAASVIPADGTANLTATVNSVSRSASISLASPPALSALSCASGTLGSGASTACTVNLTKSALSAISVATASDNAKLAVPAAVTIAAGAPAATFTATASTITADDTAGVTARLNGATKIAAITLSATPVLSSFSCTPASLAPGASATCSIGLSKTAQTAVNVTLASDNPALSTPATVAVSAGMSTSTFTVTASASTESMATVTASLASVSIPFAITLSAPAGSISDLLCTPSTLTPNTSAVCTITLSQSAATAITIPLSSDNSALWTPVSTSIPAGILSVRFTVNAGAQLSNGTANVKATLGSSSKSFAVTLSGSLPASLSALSCNPGSVSPGASSTCTITLSRPAESATMVTLSRSNAGLSVPASVAIAAGISSANFTASAGSTATSGSTTVTASLDGISKSATIMLVAPATLSGLSCGATSLASGASTMCTVHLSQSAASATTVALSSSNGAVSAPSSVAIAAGTSSAAFTVSAGSISADGSATITASLDGVSKSVTIALSAPSGQLVQVSAVSCSNTILTPNGAVFCTVTLSRAAASLTTVGLSSSNPTVTVPQSMTVGAGAWSGQFVAVAGSVTAAGSATIAASLNSSAKTVALSLSPAPSPLKLSCSDQVLQAGKGTVCTVALAQSGKSAAKVSWQSSSPALELPSSGAVIPASRDSAKFTVFGGAVSVSTKAYVIATMDSVSQAFMITVMP